MTLERGCDPKIDRQSTSGCVNDSVLTGKVSYTLALSTASASIGPIHPGIYMVFLDGLDPIRTVVLKTGGSTVTAGRPSAGREGGRDSVILPGSLVERLRVLPSGPYVAALLTQGTGTLYLVPLVTT